MNEREKTMHSILRQELRRHHFFGGGIIISREDAPEFEKALARAEYELGLLDPEVAVKVYGFSEVVKDDLVEPVPADITSRGTV